MDNNIDETLFLTKANNRIKKIYNSITLDEVDKIKHFISDDFYQKIKKIIEDNNNKNLKLIYDEVNVACNIKKIKEEENNYIVIVECISKFLKYYVSKDNNEYASGDNNNRVVLKQKITFYKKKDGADNQTIKCSGCGSNFDIEETGICPYCGKTYELSKYDYIIEKVEL